MNPLQIQSTRVLSPTSDRSTMAEQCHVLTSLGDEPLAFPMVAFPTSTARLGSEICGWLFDDESVLVWNCDEKRIAVVDASRCTISYFDKLCDQVRYEVFVGRAQSAGSA